MRDYDYVYEYVQVQVHEHDHDTLSWSRAEASRWSHGTVARTQEAMSNSMNSSTFS